MRTSLEESGWCQRERWFNLPVLCSGMVGFGQQRILGPAGKEHPSPLFPRRQSARYWSLSSWRSWINNRICHQYFYTSPTAGEGRGGGGCSFPAGPIILRWPKPTTPIHRTGKLNHLSFRHHPLSSKDVLTISSSILSTTRLGELYFIWHRLVLEWWVLKVNPILLKATNFPMIYPFLHSLSCTSFNQ